MGLRFGSAVPGCLLSLASIQRHRFPDPARALLFSGWAGLLLSEFDDISERQQWLEIARDQARFLSELPRKLDRVLSIAAETEATATPEHRAERQSGSSLVLGGLLAAMGAIALLVHHFGEQHQWVEPVGALVLLLTGGLALASATRA
jgi:hypothetical protein